ncbi:phosphonate C-P lyase system protein PhnH [Natrialba swarupiae]|uniref:Phosphonate C-P lyase system protein PhnH n=1 Tax=Natrialba swarupiae TaxID=2448032 RepID=A0A5D5AT68_9EURY|nr:phosphonate C-P lyase system protein PhnH [Natrialba swarupiae]TYT62700.1 phosphonate C-P lyase system protein PhnH [Natrialba swarupiae]
MRALGIDPVGDVRATFRALVDATARPGTIQSTPTAPADRAVLATLVDHEVGLYTEDDRVADALSSEGRLERAAVADADVVHVDGAGAVDLEAVSRGTLKEPSDGASIVYRVDALREDPAASRLGVAVSGPGVPSERTFGVDGLTADELAAFEELTVDFPRGVDVVLAADRAIVGLPRSVDTEVR